MEKTQSYTRHIRPTNPNSSTSEGTTSESSAATIDAPSTLPNDNVRVSEPAKDLSFLHDVPITISAELGRCTMTIRRLLALTTGSILTLTEDPQVQVTVKANGNEVGVRITEISDQKE